jgi:hypothetical protein
MTNFETYCPTSLIEYVNKIYISFNSYYYPTGDFFYTDKILNALDTYNVTAGDGGFDNGLIVGLMLSNSGLI